MVHSVRVSLRVHLARTRDKVHQWFPGPGVPDSIVTLSPLISTFPIGVGVSSSKSSNLV
jgi:hypothetical protein